MMFSSESKRAKQQSRRLLLHQTKRSQLGSQQEVRRNTLSLLVYDQDLHIQLHNCHIISIIVRPSHWPRGLHHHWPHLGLLEVGMKFAKKDFSGIQKCYIEVNLLSTTGTRAACTEGKYSDCDHASRINHIQFRPPHLENNLKDIAQLARNAQPYRRYHTRSTQAQSGILRIKSFVYH